MAGIARTIENNPDYRSGLRARADEVVQGITSGLKKELTRPPETPFEQDISNVETAIRSGVSTVASGLGNAAESAMTGLTSGVKSIGSGLANYFINPAQAAAPPVTTAMGASPSGVAPPQSPSVTVPAPAAKPAGGGLARPTEVAPPVETTPEPERRFPETRGLIQMNGQTTYVPETREQREARVNVGGLVVPQSQASDVISQRIESLVSDLMTPRVTPGGLRVSNKKLDMVKDLRVAQLGLQKGMEQARMTGEYGLAGHRISSETSVRNAEESRKIERERLKFDIDKFNEQNDMKNPDNYVKMLALLSPEKETTSFDDEGNTIKGRTKDFVSGMKLLSEMGYKSPTGFKPPASSPAAPPAKGTVVKGYKFKGGNPNDKKNWEKI